MADVVATRKGYFGGIVRDVGEPFSIPDEIWRDEKRRPSWVTLDVSRAFGGKGDHDGDGRVGGSKPKGDDAVATIPADWQDGSAAERKALAKAISGNSVPNAKEADAIISAEVEKRAQVDSGDEREPFADAPEPQTIEGNGVEKALGGPEPDWLPPSEMTPKAVED